MGRTGMIRLALASVCVLVAVGTFASRGSATPDEIAPQAKRVSGNSDVRLVKNPDGPFSGIEGQLAFTDEITGDEYAWDTRGGFVRHYLRRAGYKPGKRAGEKSRQEVLATAEQWANRCYQGRTLEGMKTKIVRKVEGAGGPDERVEYLVEYRRFKGEAATYDHIEVRVDAATCEVMTVDQEVGEVGIPVIPVVTKGEATAIAAAEVRVPIVCVTDATLLVGRETDGRERLVWVVEIRTGDSEFEGKATVVVDAATGRVVDVGRSW